MKKKVTASYRDQAMQYPLAEKLAQIAEEHGYYINDCYIENTDNIRISISRNTPRVNDYLPEVQFRKDEFKIQTSSYGSLSVDDFGKVAGAYNAAYNMVSEMYDAFDLIGVVPGETVELFVED